MAGVQRKDLKTISEFTVDRDKINLIEKYKEKIERLYEVEVKFDNVNETESKQWIIVEGENIDRMSAKVMLSVNIFINYFPSRLLLPT